MSLFKRSQLKSESRLTLHYRIPTLALHFAAAVKRRLCHAFQQLDIYETYTKHIRN